MESVRESGVRTCVAGRFVEDIAVNQDEITWQIRRVSPVTHWRRDRRTESGRPHLVRRVQGRTRQLILNAGDQRNEGVPQILFRRLGGAQSVW
jgi:hypothetical protein